MMNRIASMAFIVCFGLLGVAVCYGCIAFVAWDIAWPPSNDFYRVLFLIALPLFVGVGVMIASVILEDISHD